MKPDRQQSSISGNLDSSKHIDTPAGRKEQNNTRPQKHPSSFYRNCLVVFSLFTFGGILLTPSINKPLPVVEKHLIPIPKTPPNQQPPALALDITTVEKKSNPSIPIQQRPKTINDSLQDEADGKGSPHHETVNQTPPKVLAATGIESRPKNQDQPDATALHNRPGSASPSGKQTPSKPDLSSSGQNQLPNPSDTGARTDRETKLAALKDELLAKASQALASKDQNAAIRNARLALTLFPDDAVPQNLLNRAQNTLARLFTDPVNGMEFILIEGGCYLRGSNDGGSDERPVRKVCVDDFYLGKYEVTQAQYQKIIGANPARFLGENHPVEQVSWEDIRQFINRFNSRSGRQYRLPTETEWEYAASSGGKDKKYAGTDQDSVLGIYAWYKGNSGTGTHPVGKKLPNDLGLYDMSGNVWEWCANLYTGNYDSLWPPDQLQTSPQGPEYAVRGGSWGHIPYHLRLTDRYHLPPNYRRNTLGFRLAMNARRLP